MKTKLHTRRDAVEKDFLSALDRLVSRKPKNKALKLQMARGTFRLSFSTVAMEAGHSRTLIAFENCAYPGVRRRITEHLAPVGTATTLTSVNHTLRAVNKELQRKLKHQEHEMANHLAARRAAEKRLSDYQRAAKKRDGFRVVSDITPDPPSRS